jgi:hypothetical protein
LPLFASLKIKSICTNCKQNIPICNVTTSFRNDRRDRTLLTLAECLDECLEERRFACRSVMYSERFQVCKLSEFDQYNGELIYDGEYDYFENLMGQWLRSKFL